MASRRAPLGALRDVVTIQGWTETPDGEGGQTRTPVTVATVWASVRPWARAGGETLQTGKVTARGEYEVEMSYRADVTAGMRLLWTPYQGTARVLEILEPPAPVDGRPDRLRLQCGEAY